MDWKKLLTPQRLGKAKPEEDIKPGRTPFHRDYDRLVFSSESLLYQSLFWMGTQVEVLKNMVSSKQKKIYSMR